MKNENVVCVPVSEMKKAFRLEDQYWKANEQDINQLQFEYRERASVEKDFNYKQLIPYAIVQNGEGKILVYQRCGSEKRLSNMYSVGIGGHVNDKDEGDNLYEVLTNGLIREFEEEVGVKLKKEQVNLLGMINEEISEVGHCHTGIVFHVDLDGSQMKFDAEIGNPQWTDPNQIDLSKFELWSSLAIKVKQTYCI